MNLPHSQKSQRIAGEASPGRRFSALAWSSVAAFALFVLIAGRVAASTPPAVDSTFEQPLGSHAMHLVGPMGIGFDRRAQEIVVANTDAGRIEFFDEHGHSTGSFIHQVRGSSGDLQVGHPKHVAVDGLGRIYVVDIGSPDVDVCDFRGRNLATIALPAPDDRLETGVFSLPVVVRSVTHAVFTAEIGDFGAGFPLFEHGDDLFLSVLLCFH